MKLVLDTSAYSAIYKGDRALSGYISHEIFIPVIVVGELRAGFKNGTRNAENEQNLVRFLDQPNVTLVGLTSKTTQKYAQIYADLKKSGRPIGTNDMWIAAICLENGMPLLTLDSDFRSVSGLELVLAS